jgi:NADPH-dependent ferric siderophore reductase
MRSLMDRLMVRAAVTRTARTGPRSRGIVLSGADLRNLTWRPGQHVRVFFAAPSNLFAAVRSDGREYSIWNYDPAEGSIELRIFQHGHGGPGERWSVEARPGDLVALTRPEGHLVLSPDAPFHLMVGEDTASIAYGPMLHRVPGDVPVYGVIEVDEPTDRQPLPRADELTWVYRHGASAASSTRLVDAVRKLDLPGGPGAAYVAGEARTCQLVRDHLMRERGWSRRAVVTEAFWSPGRRGH